MPPSKRDPSPAVRPSSGARRNLVTEAAILEAARTLLGEAGYEGFSIDEVARRARAGKPTIYRWWRTRADLLAAVYASERALRVLEPDTGRLIDDLAEFARVMLEGWRTSAGGEAMRGLLAEALASGAAKAVLRSTLEASLQRPTTAMIARAARRREIEPADLDAVVELYCALLLQRLVAGDLDADRAAIARSIRLLASGRGRK